MDAVTSGKYDTDHLAIIMTQTGGGCRASNYVGFIRRALEKAGYPQIPVISLNLSSLESNPGFKINFSLAQRGIYCLIFGDILMRCIYATRLMRPRRRHRRHASEMGKENNGLCFHG